MLVHSLLATTEQCWYLAQYWYWRHCRYSWLFCVIAVLAGTLCSIISGAAWLGAGITDVSLLAHFSRGQPTVAWEMSRGRSNGHSSVGWSHHVPSASEPSHLHCAKYISENCLEALEKSLQAAEDYWK